MGKPMAPKHAHAQERGRLCDLRYAQEALREHSEREGESLTA